MVWLHQQQKNVQQGIALIMLVNKNAKVITYRLVHGTRLQVLATLNQYVVIIQFKFNSQPLKY